MICSACAAILSFYQILLYGILDGNWLRYGLRNLLLLQVDKMSDLFLNAHRCGKRCSAQVVVKVNRLGYDCLRCGVHLLHFLFIAAMNSSKVVIVVVVVKVAYS